MSDSAFPLTEAQITSLFVQSVAYGIHVVTFSVCIWTLLQSSKTSPRRSTWPWFTVAVVLFIIGTIDVVFNFYHNMIAFIYYTGPGGAAYSLSRISNWLAVMMSAWFFLEGIFSDAVLVQACRPQVDAETVLMILTDISLLDHISSPAGCTCAARGAMDSCYLTTSIPNVPKLKPFLTAYCSTTLALNIITTSMIVYRIGTVSRQASQYIADDLQSSNTGTSLGDINWIFVESALLYTASVAISLITEVVGSNALYNVTDVSLELAGISFDLIIIRIGRDMAAERKQSETVRSTFAVRVTTTVTSIVTEESSERVNAPTMDIYEGDPVKTTPI
ncbi:hypothetical protein WOLCODRAFT_146841 [Wolfiporia cocos MD-104 SS10]|uniref:Uncharacterized protein n=1 Tax=Wolfiporia cocos (strain MD-104) TaxID=742152 RepID=A0A2H3JJS7_WOLCO|nr:hypothetical protein WOLCODRAFT_146841 [Wolfiporia cocos MD-104 SS10]